MSSLVLARRKPLALPDLLRGPAAAGLLLLLLFAVVWLWHLDSVALSPPADNIEQLTWMRSLEWGYYKHPPAPTWMMWAFAQLAGWSAWSSYLLGALCTLVSVAFYGLLLREIQGPRFALVAVLAVLGITFYNGRLNYFNHNVALMLWTSASAWLWWRILTAPRLRWWLALGVVAGLGMLSKYQYALVVAGGMWLYVQHGLWRSPAHRRGLLWCVALATLVCLPHAVWLLGAKRGPFSYAVQSSLGAGLGASQRLAWSAQWLADGLFNRCLPAILLLLPVWWMQRRPRVPQSAGVTGQVTSRRGRSLLYVWGFLPPLLMAAMGVLWGVDLQLQWGTAFALWTVPAGMLALGMREKPLGTGRVMAVAGGVFLLLQGALLWQSYDTSAFGRHRPVASHWREFPSREFALAVAGPARLALGGPIDIVSGPPAVSGAVALLLEERPRVLIGHDAGISPWIRPDELERKGVLELWPPGDAPPDVVRVFNGWGWRVMGPRLAGPDEEAL